MSQREVYLKYTPYTDVTQLKRLRLIVEQISMHAQRKQKNKLKILDLGCGIGGVALPLAALGHHIIGVDIDSESISVCNRKNPFPNATFIVGNAESLDLPEQFDIVIASELLEHVPHPDLIMQTLDRHLIKGGMGIVSVPNGYSFFELVISRYIQKSKLVSLLYKSPRIYKLLSGVPCPFYSTNVFCHHIPFFSFGDIKRLFDSCCLKILHVGHLDIGIFPCRSRLKLIKKVSCMVAKYVPHSFAGGWLFYCRSYKTMFISF